MRHRSRLTPIAVRDDEGFTAIHAGDAILFEPGEAHSLTNTGQADLVIRVVADNPIGESNGPDSGKWAIHSPENRIIRSQPLDYDDGEE